MKRALPTEILLVEDNPGDVFLTSRALEKSGASYSLNVVDNGEDALAFLRRAGAYTHAPRIDIVLLDLNLPRLSGKEVLEEIKDDDALRVLPVIVLTSSSANNDIVTSYFSRANAYMVKPGEPATLERLIRNFTSYWLDTAALPTR